MWFELIFTGLGLTLVRKTFSSIMIEFNLKSLIEESSYSVNYYFFTNVLQLITNIHIIKYSLLEIKKIMVVMIMILGLLLSNHWIVNPRQKTLKKHSK